MIRIFVNENEYDKALQMAERVLRFDPQN